MNSGTGQIGRFVFHEPDFHFLPDDGARDAAGAGGIDGGDGGRGGGIGECVVSVAAGWGEKIGNEYQATRRAWQGESWAAGRSGTCAPGFKACFAP